MFPTPQPTSRRTPDSLPTCCETKVVSSSLSSSPFAFPVEEEAVKGVEVEEEEEEADGS